MSQIDREQLGEMLSAYLDGQLDEKASRLVERVLAEDAGARVLLGELRATVEVIGALPRHSAPDSIQEDLRLLLERNELLGGTNEAPAARSRRGLSRGRWLSMAAMIAFVFMAGVYFLQDWDVTPLGGAGRRLAERERTGDVDELVAEKADAGERSAGDRLALRDSRSVVGRAVLRDRAENAATVSPPSLGGPSVAGLADAWSSAAASSNRLEQKLTSRAGLRHLQRHRFDDEPIRLKVIVADDPARDSAVSSLIQRLRRRRVREVSASSTPSGGYASATDGFFYRGRRGDNFQAERSDQLLVSLPADELEGLLGDVHRTAEKGDISLAAGPVTVRGLDETRLAFRRVEESLPGMAQGPPGERLADARVDRPTDRDQPSLLDGASRAVGITPGVVPGTPSGQGAEGSPRRRGRAPDPSRSTSAQEKDPAGREAREPKDEKDDAPTDRAKEVAQEGPLPPAAPGPAAPEAGSRMNKVESDDSRPGELKEPTSLVERRARELEGTTGRRGLAPAAGEAVASRKPHVTLVVEFAIVDGGSGVPHAE